MAVRLGLFLGKRKAIRKRWLPYQEGHWLWIPLRLYGLHAVASVARIGPKGKVIAIYGFGPARTSKQTDEEVGRSRAESADLIAMCGDLGVMNGARLGGSVTGASFATPSPRLPFGYEH